MVLASIDYELWRGQAQNGVNLAFQVKFDLEGQGQSPPKTIGTLTKLFCTFCPNLVVLAWTRRDLWHGQARGWRTHTQTDTHTDRQTQATTIPEGQNWPWVKNYRERFTGHDLSCVNSLHIFNDVNHIHIPVKYGMSKPCCIVSKHCVRALNWPWRSRMGASKWRRHTSHCDVMNRYHQSDVFHSITTT